LRPGLSILSNNSSHSDSTESVSERAWKHRRLPHSREFIRSLMSERREQRPSSSGFPDSHVLSPSRAEWVVTFLQRPIQSALALIRLTAVRQRIVHPGPRCCSPQSLPNRLTRTSSAASMRALRAFLEPGRRTMRPTGVTASANIPAAVIDACRIDMRDLHQILCRSCSICDEPATN
jgi:hypothetical protein